ncbi:MAG: alpha/beta hydrolase [Qingshengfaniella sp.]
MSLTIPPPTAPMAPEMQDLLALIRDAGAPPPQDLGVAGARQTMRERRSATQLDPAQRAAVRDLTGGACPMRLYRPSEAPEGTALPALIYLHGGGWTIGDLEVFDALCHDLAEASGCVVVSVAYRLAPEAPFPAAVDDTIAALALIHRDAADLGIDNRRLAVGGDSAGGNLATIAAIMTRDAGLTPPLRAQVLIYPATDAGGDYASRGENGTGKLLEAATMDWFYDCYVPDAGQRSDWRVSPIRVDSLSDLPPCWLLTAGHDPLRDEGIAYGVALEQAGIAVDHVHLPDQIHGFITMTRITPAAGETVARIAAFLRQTLT